MKSVLHVRYCIHVQKECVIVGFLGMFYLISLLLLSPVPSPPSGVMVSQNGLNSLLVTWTPSAGPNVTGYTIFYQAERQNPRHSVEVEETNTSVTITGLMRGATYNISIMAKSNTLPSDVIAGPETTIGNSTLCLCFVG